jgi:hypothetical protein
MQKKLVCKVVNCPVYLRAHISEIEVQGKRERESDIQFPGFKVSYAESATFGLSLDRCQVDQKTNEKQQSDIGPCGWE